MGDPMERGVLTRLRCLRKLNMMMLSSVTIVMTRDVTPPMSQTTSPNRKRSVRRTSERAVSSNMRRSLSMRLSRSVEPHLSRIVMFRDLRSVELNMSLSAGPNKRFMMLKMMLLSAEPRLRRSVRMRHRIHHQHQVLQVAKGGLQCFQEECQEVHPNHWMYQGTKRALCPSWLWIQARS